MAGHGYVPLNRTFPVDRTRLMLRKSMARSIIVDSGSEAQLKAILTDLDASLLVICPDRQDVNELAAIFPQHRIVGGTISVLPKIGSPLARFRIQSPTCFSLREVLANQKALWSPTAMSSTTWIT